MCVCVCVCVSVAVFAEAHDRLSTHIINYGYIESRDEYLCTLAAADVVISTALHEFFGVAMYVIVVIIFVTSHTPQQTVQLSCVVYDGVVG